MEFGVVRRGLSSDPPGRFSPFFLRPRLWTIQPNRPQPLAKSPVVASFRLNFISLALAGTCLIGWSGQQDLQAAWFAEHSPAVFLFCFFNVT